MSGVDGVMIDWYGVQGTNGDIGQSAHELQRDRRISIDDFGMEFGVVMEDRFSANIEPGEGQRGLSPRQLFQQAGVHPARRRQRSAGGRLRTDHVSDSRLNGRRSSARRAKTLTSLTLWYEPNEAGANADGEYAWIYEDAARTII